MYRTAVTDKAALAAEEARMARAAASGDAAAFAALYERYEQRAFNLAYRITGSEADAADAVQGAFLDVMRRPPHLADHELTFGRCLFTATYNACHALIGKQPHSGPAEAGIGPEQVDIREASLRLPERQREVLALHDLEDLSYEEIGEMMAVNGNTVAQLISRARINLCDEMLGTSLAAVAAPSAECERALPLIAARDDGQLEPASGDADWLDAHLAGCRRCRAGVEAMKDADASYRAWAPIAVVPWLLKETMAKAAARAGADWSAATADAAAARTAAESQPRAPSTYLKDSRDRRSPRHRMTVAAGLAALLLLGGVAAVFARDDPSATTADSAGAARGTSAGVPRLGVGVPAKAGKTKRRAAERKPATRTTAVSATTETETTSTPVQALPTAAGTPSEPDSHPNPPGGTAVNPTHQISDPTPGSKHEPAPAATPAPQPAATTAPEEAPAVEEASGKGSHGKEPAPLPIPIPIPKLPGHQLK